MIFRHATPTMKAASRSHRRPAGQISWEQILSNLDDGVITVDAEGRIVFFNEAAEVLTEISSSAAATQPLAQIFKREPWLCDLIAKTSPPRQESARGEGDFVTRWGRKTPVSATASPLYGNRGEFFGAIVLLRDIKQRRELEEDLKRADRLASIGTLAAGLAHEIKNPLGGIKGAAQLLRRSTNGDAKVNKFTDIMIREVDRVNHLIEQLLQLSQPAELHLEPLNIHQILDDVLLLESQSDHGKANQVRKRFDPSLPPVRGDRGQITQVFLNLIKNGFQAMTAPGTLTVTTRVETDYHIRGGSDARNRFIWIDVADEGAGINDEDLKQIFSPFFTTKTNGTGLGLATCYRIVNEHGGLIRVDSAAGQGSTFKVALIAAE
jgi:two-component system nitrogen regulation sensor histidine kinase GlnL